jgi:hypothetical protein
MSRTAIQGVLILPFLLARISWSADITYRVTGDPGACHDVRVGKWPTEYRRPGTNGCSYEFRTPANNVLYMGVHCGESLGKWESPVKYGVDLVHQDQIMRIDPSAWGAAAELKVEMWKTVQVPLQPNGFQYRGHLLEKSGPEWYDPGLRAKLISPGQTHIALNSSEGGVGYPGPFEPGPIRAKGKYWIDIYDVRTGQRALIIQGTFHGGADADPGLFQGRAFWLTDRYYVLPLEPEGMRRLLICDVDQAMSKLGGTANERK